MITLLKCPEIYKAPLHRYPSSCLVPETAWQESRISLPRPSIVLGLSHNSVRHCVRFFSHIFSLISDQVQNDVFFLHLQRSVEYCWEVWRTICENVGLRVHRGYGKVDEKTFFQRSPMINICEQLLPLFFQ